MRLDGCASDDECKNFEECRPTTAYANGPGQPVTQPTVERRALSFCHPKRDDNGRIGPIDDYAVIACETGGGYIYVSQSGTLPANMGWLPFALDGLWELPVSVDVFGRGQLGAGEAHLLQVNMQVTLGGRTITQSASQLGSTSANDNRPVLFSAP